MLLTEIEDWSIELTVSVSKDELADKKRGDTQDALTVVAQNAAVLGPGAVAAADTLTNALVQDLVPGTKPIQMAPPSAAVPGSAPAPLPAGPPQ